MLAGLRDWGSTASLKRNSSTWLSAALFTPACWKLISAIEPVGLPSPPPPPQPGAASATAERNATPESVRDKRGRRSMRYLLSTCEGRTGGLRVRQRTQTDDPKRHLKSSQM